MKRPATTRPAIDQLAVVFKTLADRTRLRILALLGKNEVCVCHIHDSLRLPQPTVSRHLAYWRRAGLVAARRDGVWMHYDNGGEVLSEVWIRADLARPGAGIGAGVRRIPTGVSRLGHRDAEGPAEPTVTAPPAPPPTMRKRLNAWASGWCSAWSRRSDA